jgi:hypothetical protein
MKYESTSDILVILVEATDDRSEVMQRLGYLGDQPKPVLVVLPGDAALRRPGDLRELRYVIESQGHQSVLVIMGNERLRLWARHQGYSVFSSIENCVAALPQQGIVDLPQLLQEAKLVDVSHSNEGVRAQLETGGIGDRWEAGTMGETYSPAMMYLNSRKDSLGGEIEQADGEEEGRRGDGRDKGPYGGGEEVMAVWVANANNIVDRDTEPLRMRLSRDGGKRIFHEEELFYPERIGETDVNAGRDKSGPYTTWDDESVDMQLPERVEKTKATGAYRMGPMDLAYVGVPQEGQAAMRTFFVEEDMPSLPERGGEEEETLMLPVWAQSRAAWDRQFDVQGWEEVKEDKVLGAKMAVGIMRDRVLITLIILLGIGIAGGVVFGSILYR